MIWKKQQGISLLEILLLVALVAVLLLAAAQRLVIWNSTYKQTKNLAQVREFVAEMMQGAKAYYFANCHASNWTPPSNLKCSDLISAGGVTPQQCDAMDNAKPWGASFVVNILEPVNAPPFFQLQVQGTFNSYPYDITKLVSVLSADAYVGNNQLTWTRLPSNSNVNQGVWYRVPGNVVAATNANEIGGTHFDSGLWMMNAGLAQFSAVQGKAANNFACPD